jgi:hypothetical protein
VIPALPRRAGAVGTAPNGAQHHLLARQQTRTAGGGPLSRLSNVVKRLEQRRFISCATDPTNGRYTTALLTDAGWECVVRAAPGHVNAVRHLILDPLSAEQIEALRIIGGLIADRIRCGAPSPTE